ncbi:MAG TPA: type II toxin-antitoxin system VapC family toxin [Ktedonobacterales bacterium]|nr:type II toxin-antitoxin system VapC family toxin [Ktedonobacterales bacterium]
MRKYLLDNGPLVALLKGRRGAERLMRPWLVAQEVATSQIAYGEAIEYIRGDSDFVRRREELRTLLREVTPLRLTYGILERYADLRRAMRPPHGPGLIGDVDTLIAATALEHGLTIVTLDGDFARVPALPVMRLTRADLLA